MNFRNCIQPTKNFITFDNPRERWMPMPDLGDGRCFVSSEGRVMKLTDGGIFKQLKTQVSEGHLMVRIGTVSNQTASCFRVSRLVLTYFKGGYSCRRKITFKNSNKLDCSLMNLCWYSGFDTEIDFQYLKYLNKNTLDPSDQKVVNYFYTEDVSILFELVEDHTLSLYKMLSNKALGYHVGDNKSSIVLELVDLLKAGKYKPVSKQAYYPREEFFFFLTNVVLRLAAKEVKLVYTDKETFLDQQYLKAV